MRVPPSHRAVTRRLLLLLLAVAGPLSAAPVWQILDEPAAAARIPSEDMEWIVPERYVAAEVDSALMTAALADAPLEAAMARGQVSDTIVPIPAPDGSVMLFHVVDSPVMAPELEAWMASQGFPVKTYRVTSIEDPRVTGRIDWGGPRGFHAMIETPEGTFFVDPMERDNTTLHASYWRRDYSHFGKSFSCGVEGIPDRKSPEQPIAARDNAPQLRTFRFACSATGEYTAFHGGTVALGQAAIITSTNRVNQIYERDVSCRLVLVANNPSLVFTNSATDPFTNSDGFAMLGQNQTTVDNVIGNANYDVGHVFSTGGGGVASLGSICSASQKARGVTGQPQPVNDPFDIDYVAHELGHQFGANHTFNSTTSSCGGGNRAASAAYEPGSGTTIMAYAGICGSDNVQPNSDAHFHTRSLDEINAELATVNCFNTLASGNDNAPVVNAGPDYTIPANTPFELVGSANDAQDSALTYCWEQFDLGSATTLAQGDTGSGPIIRSFLPSTSPTRMIPRRSNLLAGTLATGERLPTTTRTLNFRLTVRDNRPGGGRTDFDSMRVTVQNTGSAFSVTTLNAASPTQSGPINVTWNVAGTNAAPINTANVQILLSTDGGQTFPIVLAESTPNDGAHTVALPNITAASCRLMVRAVDNIYFDVNNVNFAIQPGSVEPFIDISGTPVLNDTTGNGNSNGLPDPGESSLQLNISLVNAGTTATDSVTATLSSNTATASVASGPLDYGAIGAAQTVSGPSPFEVALDPAHPCGTPISLSLTVSGTGFATRVLPINLTTGRTFQNVVLTEGFDGASTTFTSQALQGTNNWAVRARTPNNTVPNVASYEPGVATVADAVWISPPVTAATQLTFFHTFGLESAWDGGVLEVSTNNGTSWTDLGSRITEGGYNGTVAAGSQATIRGRQAWTGGTTLGTPTRVTVNLVDFSGQTIRVRWRFASDESVASAGWRIDSVQFAGTPSVVCDAPSGATPTPTPSPTPSPSPSPSPTASPSPSPSPTASSGDAWIFFGEPSDLPRP